MHRILALACIVTLGAASCARLQANETQPRGASLCAKEDSPPNPAWQPPDRLPDWDHPLVTGVRVAEAEAATYLPFPAVIPRELGRPLSIYLIPPDPNPSVAALAVVYQHEECGRFMLMEVKARFSQETLEQSAAACDPDQGCQGRSTMVALSNGIRAAQLEGAVANSIKWLQGGMYFDIIGPSEALGPSDLSELADLVIKGAEGQL